MCKSESSVSLQDELTLMPLSCREVRRLLHAQSTMSGINGKGADAATSKPS
jgi:hypothetical protein